MVATPKDKKRAWQSTAFFSKKTKSFRDEKRRSWEFAKLKKQDQDLRISAFEQHHLNVQAAVNIAEDFRFEEERKGLEKKRLAARTDLVSILRQQPGVYKAFGLQLLGRDATDVELLRAFKLVDTPAKVLRTAGCNPRDIATIMQLVPIAYQEVPPPKPKTEEEQHYEIVYGRGKWLLVVVVVLSGLLLVVGLALGSVAIWYMQDEAGWRYGRCELSRFENGPGNCTGRVCLFTVNLWKKGRADFSQVHNWKLPVRETTSRLGELTVDGEAFRCCNLNGYQCCGFYDAEDELYCDAWGYRKDLSGRQCPESPWVCRYRMADNPLEGEDEISRLEEASVSERKPIWSLAAAGVATFSIGAVFLCLSAGCRPCMVRCGSHVRHLCEGDRDDAMLEAARLEGLPPILRSGKKTSNQRAVQPPQPLPRPPPQPAASLNRGGALTPPASALSGTRAVSRSSSRPATGSSRPATGGSRPATGGSRPATGSSRPATGGSRPATGSSRPASGRSRVSFEEDTLNKPAVKRDVRAKRGAMFGEHIRPAKISQVAELEVVDVQSDEQPLPTEKRRTIIPTHKLRACAAVQPGELFRPIVTPLAHPLGGSRGKRHNGRRAPVHKEELPRAQGREAWRVIDL